MPTPHPTQPGPLVLITLVTAFSLAPPPPAKAQDRADEFENLQVLPEDISRDELNEVMLGNLLGLGLRRLQGEGCLFCHVGDMEQPRDTWDYASDDKLTKRKARVMMDMVNHINGQHLAQLEERIDSTFRVTCYTCHAGRTDPRPLPTILLAAYDAGGIDSAKTHYRSLRARYLNSDAYDFRVGVLAGVAARLGNRGALDDAVAMTALNVDVYPNQASAKRIWVLAVLERAVNVDGVEAALTELDRMEPDLEEDVASPGLLDGLGWRLFRQDRKAEAIAVLRRNLEKFPEEYVPNESVAFALFDGGDRASAYRILEEWLVDHPDHDRARRLLINLRSR